MSKIYLIGEHPDKILHGISISNKMIYDRLPREKLWLLENNNFSSKLSRRFSKLFNLFHLIFKLLFTGPTKDDVVYSAISVSNFGILKSYLFFKIPMIKGCAVFIHIHRGDFIQRIDNGNSLYRYLAKDLLKKAARVVVLDTEQEKQLSQKFGVNAFSLPNTVSEEAQPKKYHSPIRSYLFLSNLIPEKGFQDAISVILTSTVPNITLTLAGACNGNEKLIESMPIEKINYIGVVRDKEKIKALMSCDVFLLPSYNEGQPISILEAMSMGILIVSTNVGGIPAMLPPNYPFLFEPGDLKSLEKMLHEIDKLSINEINNWSETLHSHYIKNFSNEIYQNRVSKLFEVKN